MQRMAFRSLAIFSLLTAHSAFAFENAKVMPKGVRKLSVRSAETSFKEKTDASGEAASVVSPLAKDLTFKQIAKGYSGINRTQVEAFLQANNFGDDESVGKFSADFAGNVSVMAPIFAIGVTERLTLGGAIPYYRANTSVKVGFRPNERGQQFLNSLADPYSNQVAKAQEAGRKLNDAVGQLNDKLATNGYSALGDWEKKGWGDTTVLAKYSALQSRYLNAAVTGGFVAPTGTGDDPDVLTDIPFGDGQWDLFSGVSLDQPILKYAYINEYFQYTAQLPGKKDVRLKTSEEPIEVPRENVGFNLGDKVEVGTSLNLDSYDGAVVGVGYNYFKKFSDRYRLSDAQAGAQDSLQEETTQTTTEAEFQLGYSGVRAYQRGQIVAPFEVIGSYKKQLRSTNAPVKDLAQLDVTMFF